MQHIFRGIKMVFGSKKMWPYIWKPLLLSAGIFLAVVLLGFAIIVPVAASLFEGWLSWLSGIGAAVLWGVIWFFAAGPFFISVSAMVSSFAWDGLRREVEEEVLQGRSAEHEMEPANMIVDACVRVPLSLFFSLIVLIVTPLSFGLFGAFIAGWLGLLEYTSAAFHRRGVLIFGQLFFDAYRVKGWFTFQLLAGLTTMIPIVNIILLPALVAGGTIMVAESRGIPDALPPKAQQ